MRKLRGALGLCLLIALGGNAGAEDTRSAAREHFMKGTEYFDLGRLGETTTTQPRETTTTPPPDNTTPPETTPPPEPAKHVTDIPTPKPEEKAPDNNAGKTKKIAGLALVGVGAAALIGGIVCSALAAKA